MLKKIFILAAGIFKEVPLILGFTKYRANMKQPGPGDDMSNVLGDNLPHILFKYSRKGALS